MYVIGCEVAILGTCFILLQLAKYQITSMSLFGLHGSILNVKLRFKYNWIQMYVC